MRETGLSSKGLRSGWGEEESDPMSSMANLADVMLVFACGLMMALITYWNVDISTVTEMLREDQVAEVQSPEEITEQLMASDGTSYIDMGKVYMDPTTGKYYMLSTDEAASAADAAQGASSAGAASAAGEGSSASNAQAGQGAGQSAANGPTAAGEGKATSVSRAEGGD